MLLVLAERHPALREMAAARLRDPVAFWQKLEKLPELKSVPPDVAEMLDKWLPEPGLKCSYAHRIAGLGSLGRRRFTALVAWRGGYVVREAKELAPSAYGWEKSTDDEVHYGAVLRQAVRDPIRSCSMSIPGSCAVWGLIAAASSCRACPRSATSSSCYATWAGRPPMSIAANRSRFPRSKRTSTPAAPVAPRRRPRNGQSHLPGLDRLEEALSNTIAGPFRPISRQRAAGFIPAVYRRRKAGGSSEDLAIPK